MVNLYRNLKMRPHGIQEARHLQKTAGIYITESCSSGLSFDFEARYIEEFDHGSHCSEAYGEMYDKNGTKNMNIL